MPDEFQVTNGAHTMNFIYHLLLKFIVEDIKVKSSDISKKIKLNKGHKPL